MTLIDGVGRGSFQAKAIRVRVRQGFRDRIKSQAGRAPAWLDPSYTESRADVSPCRHFWRYTPGATVGFDTHVGAGCVTAWAFFSGVSQMTPSTPGVRLPWFSVTRLTASDFGRKRVGQQTLKGSHLSPSARLCRLHDTRLEPTHNGVSFLPVDGMPVHRVAGDRTSRCCHCCHLLCLLSRLAKLSRDARPAWEVSPLSRGVMLPLAQPLSTPLQDGVRFLPRPLPAPPSARLAARFPLRERYGLTTFRTSTTG